MPILAICPYCREGKVRAPDNAVGLSATCPKCYNCFTVIESKELASAPPPKTAVPKAVAAVPKAAAVAAPPATAIAKDIRPPIPFLDDDEPTTPAPKPAPTVSAPVRLPVTANEPDEDHDDGGGREPAVVLAMIAISLAGIGMMIGVGMGMFRMPYGRIVITAMAFLGMLVGSFGVLVADRNRKWPAVGTLANVVALLFVTLLPNWLGLEGWLPPKIEDDSKQIKAVAFQGGTASQPAGEGDWINANQGSWQRGDVRVTVTNALIAPVVLKGPKDKQKFSKEKYLTIGLAVRNSGVARQFDFRSWNDKPATPEAPVVKVIDSAGNELKLATFEDGWDVTTRGTGGSLVPGKMVEDTLVIEAPTGAFDHVKLELPSEAFGEPAAPVRLLIPKAFIQGR